ncbi:hypothetical protein [Arcticibacter tournemirensis]
MLLSILNRLERLDYLIRSKSTGALDELARRLEISERTLYEILSEMRDLGACIKYSRSRRTYYYYKEGGLSLKFHEE